MEEMRFRFASARDDDFAVYGLGWSYAAGYAQEHAQCAHILGVAFGQCLECERVRSFLHVDIQPLRLRHVLVSGESALRHLQRCLLTNAGVGAAVWPY